MEHDKKQVYVTLEWVAEQLKAVTDIKGNAKGFDFVAALKAYAFYLESKDYSEWRKIINFKEENPENTPIFNVIRSEYIEIVGHENFQQAFLQYGQIQYSQFCALISKRIKSLFRTKSWPIMASFTYKLYIAHKKHQQGIMEDLEGGIYGAFLQEAHRIPKWNEPLCLDASLWEKFQDAELE